jgi:hypothetical protein
MHEYVVVPLMMMMIQLMQAPWLVECRGDEDRLVEFVLLAALSWRASFSCCSRCDRRTTEGRLN